MTFDELQNQPAGTYLIIEYNDSKFKFYPSQVGEAFWQFLSEHATITQGKDEEDL
jgi:hypothetical protein